METRVLEDRCTASGGSQYFSKTNDAVKQRRKIPGLAFLTLCSSGLVTSLRWPLSLVLLVHLHLSKRSQTSVTLVLTE